MWGHQQSRPKGMLGILVQFSVQRVQLWLKVYCHSTNVSHDMMTQRYRYKGLNGFRWAFSQEMVSKQRKGHPIIDEILKIVINQCKTQVATWNWGFTFPHTEEVTSAPTRGLIHQESFTVNRWQESCFDAEDEEVQHCSSQFDSSWHWSASFINPAFTCLSEAPISQLSGGNYKGAAQSWRRAKKPGACHEDAVSCF